MPSNHLILCCPLLLLPSVFPSIRVFFQWVGCLHQVAKVLELSLHSAVSFQWIFRVDFLWDWLTGLISLQSKELSSVFSSITVWKHQFFIAQPSLWSNLPFMSWIGSCRCGGWHSVSLITAHWTCLVVSCPSAWFIHVCSLVLLSHLSS